MRGSALLPSRNSSSVSLSSWFLSIWSNILSTRFCGVFSSSDCCGCCPCWTICAIKFDYPKERRREEKRKKKNVRQIFCIRSLPTVALRLSVYWTIKVYCVRVFVGTSYLRPSGKWHPRCCTFRLGWWNHRCLHRIAGMPLRKTISTYFIKSAAIRNENSQRVRGRGGERESEKNVIK